MAGQLGDLVISLSADIARFRDDMGKAAKVSQDAAQSIVRSQRDAATEIQGIFSTIGKAVAGFTAILGGGAMFSGMIGQAKDTTAEVVKLSRAFGISAEQASVLRVALDDAFLSVDDAVGASDRLTRAALKNEEAFQRSGISIRDNDGNLKDSLSVMTEVNTYLLTLKEGKDRDTAAMSLYGKGWRELSGILRLTTDGLVEAEDRAKKLHLIIGQDGIDQVKKYKSSMKDVADVFESLKYQIGIALLPELTKMGTAFNEMGTDGISSFIQGLHSVEAEVVRMAMLVDKAGGSLTTFAWVATGGKFTETGRWFAEMNKMYEQRYLANDKWLQALANQEVGLDANGNPIKAKAKAKATGLYNPDVTTGSGSWQDDPELVALFAWQEEMIQQTKEMDAEMKAMADATKLVDAARKALNATDAEMLKNSLATIENEIKERVELEKYVNDLMPQLIQAEGEWLGLDKDIVANQVKLANGLRTEIDLADKLATARNLGLDSEAKKLQSVINLQQAMNNQLVEANKLSERAAVLRGDIVGFSDSAKSDSNPSGAIYRDAYTKQQQAAGNVYTTDQQLLSGVQNNNINVTVAGSGNPQRDGNAAGQAIVMTISDMKYNMIGNSMWDI